MRDGKGEKREERGEKRKVESERVQDYLRV